MGREFGLMGAPLQCLVHVCKHALIYFALYTLVCISLVAGVADRFLDFCFTHWRTCMFCRSKKPRPLTSTSAEKYTSDYGVFYAHAFLLQRCGSVYVAPSGVRVAHGLQ